jgi:hypothetical protein
MKDPHCRLADWISSSSNIMSLGDRVVWQRPGLAITKHDRARRLLASNVELAIQYEAHPLVMAPEYVVSHLLLREMQSNRLSLTDRK